MIRERIIYINERGESIEFSARSIFHVNIKKDVKGLTDIHAQIFSIHSQGQDGDTLIGTRIRSRDIEIVGNIKARGKTEIHRHRRNLKRVLNPNYTGTLIYEIGDIRRFIDCTVESMPDDREPIFEEFTIQLFCADPYYRDEFETQNDIASWLGAFKFPEPAGLELDDEKGWEVEYREPSRIKNVVNEGDSRVGMLAIFRSVPPGDGVTNPSILNIETGEFIRIETTLIAGDTLTVNTRFGEKSVTLNRGGIESDAFVYLDIDSKYLQLEPGDNLLRYDAATNIDSMHVTIRHNNRRIM